MSFSLGIGIVTYNRQAILSETIDRVRAHTRQPDTAMVVADDGSGDGTLAMLRDKQVPVITGVNMGIAWNKNRALFLLSQMLGCETVILLEDDTQPDRTGWEADWIQAAARWGHMNLAGDWMSQYFLSGSGSVGDPVRCDMVTAQCSAYSWNALTFGGYFDPRFKGYGHEHVDHSRRLVRIGFGGVEETVDGQEKVRYFLLKGGVRVVACQSYHNAEQVQRNHQVAAQSMPQQHHRVPWLDDVQLRQFRSETDSAMIGGAERFRLTPAASTPGSPKAGGGGFFTRLFRRG
jgi:Glycosyl transferase family 2